MLFPNKTTSFNESILSKMIYILNEKENKSIKINELFKITENQFENIDEFFFALDNLYALGYVYLNNEELIYVD